MLKTHPPTLAANRWQSDVRAITKALVAIPTISPDPVGEMACAREIAAQLQAGTGLEANFWPTGDGRVNVACLLRGEATPNHGRTVLLMGHFDTVGVDEFRALDPQNSGHIAFDPDRLRTALLTKLSQGRTSYEEDVWQDIREVDEHGEPVWLFGRGACDMKSGVAINIALMRQLWQQRDQLAGNVLFLACPDEETESRGARTAVSHLLDWREAENLNYLGLINTDYAAPRNPHDDGRSIYSGTVGKLLPAFYILGVPTHVGEPFRGLDAGQIAAELVRRINLNSDLCDRWVREDEANPGNMQIEIGVPPITLQVRDLKSEYNVQTAAESFVYANWLTYTTSPAQALQVMMAEATAALREALAQRNQQYQRFTQSGAQPEQYTPQVLSYADLCQRVRHALGWQDDVLAFEQLLNTLATEIDEALLAHETHMGHGGEDEVSGTQLHLAYTADLRTKSRLLVSKLIRYANLHGPAIVVFFAPPYYPHVQPRKNELTDAFRHLLNQPNSPKVSLQGFYPYISDLSFVCLDDGIQENIDELMDNMPTFNRGYRLDFEAIRALNLPVLNFGSWGKDAHGLYERVHMPYSFQTVPQLIYKAIKRTMSNEQ